MEQTATALSRLLPVHFERLEGLGIAPKQMLVELEATSRYEENLLKESPLRGIKNIPYRAQAICSVSLPVVTSQRRN
ncbi:MAG: hypothetical protein E6I97_25475 [Chloroflexi bacterium]|nr:MAG: hypothetical protein E6I97_25475 [Chloroflexota bacterium]